MSDVAQDRGSLASPASITYHGAVWQLEEAIGTGAYATVYRCRRPGVTGVLAAKVSVPTLPEGVVGPPQAWSDGGGHDGDG